MVISKPYQVLICGLSNGQIYQYIWPILKEDFDPIIFDVHTKAITSIVVTQNNYLVSSSEDGTVFFNFIREIYEGIDLNLNK